MLVSAANEVLAARCSPIRGAQLALALLAGCVLSGGAQAALMTVTLTGTVTGTDFYRNSVYFGPNGAGNLNGMTGSISITYDTDLMVDLYPGNTPPNSIYYTTTHSPGYPSFNGIVGQNPVRSASFTVNGVTLGLDVSGPSERGRLQVEDFNPANDSYNLSAGDERLTWCPNDFQCVERVGISAFSYVNLFDLDGFQQTDTYNWTGTNLTSLTGNVRMIESILCQPASQGGQGGAAGLCPEGRFDYTATPTATHFVEFQIAGTQLSIAPATVVPLPAAGWLLATGLAGLAGIRRRRAQGC